MSTIETWVFAARCVAALGVLAAALGSAYKISLWAVTGCSTATRACATVVIVLWLLAVSFHALMMLHAFDLAGAAVLWGAVAVACSYLPGQSLRDTIRAEVARITDRARHGSNAMSFVLVAFLAVHAACLLARTMALPPLGVDTLMYHGIKAARWYQTNVLQAMSGPGSWDTYNLYPGGAEVYLAWSMLLFGDDVLVNVVDCIEWLCLGVAVLALAREMGLREPFASTAAVMTLTVPTIWLLVGSGYVEIAQALSLVLGVLFGLRFMRTTAMADAVLSLAALGLSASIKLTGLPLLAGGAVVMFLGSLRHRRMIETIGKLGFGALAAIVVVSPWLIQNTLITGYPLSPLPVKLGGITLGELNAPLGWFMRHETRPEQWYRWAHEWPLLEQIFALPGATHEGLGAMTLVPLMIAPIGVLALARRNLSAGLLIGAMYTAALIGYFSPGLSAVRFFWPVSSSRFLLPLVVIAVPSSFAWCNRQSFLSVTYCGLAWVISFCHLIAVGTRFWAPYDVRAMLVILACAAIGGTLIAWLYKARRGFALTAAATIALSAVLLTWLHDYKLANRYRAARESTVLHYIDRTCLPLAEALDEPARSHNIAVTFGPVAPPMPVYYLLGSMLQNHLSYVSIRKDGKIPPYDLDRDWAHNANAAAWISRLRRLGITDVVTRDPHGLELGWMNARPDLFHLTHDVQGGWKAFQFLPSSVPRR
jgi:hypothetical protein